MWPSAWNQSSRTRTCLAEDTRRIKSFIQRCGRLATSGDLGFNREAGSNVQLLNLDDHESLYGNRKRLMSVTKDPRLGNTAKITSGAGDLRLSDEKALAALAGRELQPNRGIPLNLDWIENIRVNTSAVERRAQTLVTRRTVKKDWQVAWLLRAISCMDLTTLSGDDTEERVRRLCSKARQPLQHELVQKLGIAGLNIQVGAVCVYHLFVETARRALEGTKINVAAVSTGFPAGLSPFEDRVSEIRRSVSAGRGESDRPFSRPHVVGAPGQKKHP